jgi:DNA-directed RNA polymerase specialized sigma subunit
MVLAHRWVFERERGPIPAGLLVLHSCDQPACVNPLHLRIGTQRENVEDAARRGRRNQSRQRKLSPEQRAEIVALYRQGGVSQSELGRRFGVSQASVSYLVRR